MKVIQLSKEIIDYGVKLINPIKQWAITKGEGINVAVLDTGIDYNHIDIKDNFRGGVNFTSSISKDYKDVAGHGTFCSGIIAGIENNVGIIGIAPKANLYAVKVLNNQEQGTLQWLLQGIDWCARNNIDIINMSLGFQRDFPALHDSVVRAYNKDIIMICAAGNNKFDRDSQFPARYPECISISAIDNIKHVAKFSTHGQSVEVAAPGVNIISCYPGNKYAQASGTSFAAPHITGAVALILSQFKKENGRRMTNIELREFLHENCEDLGIKGKDISYGYGMFHF